MKTKTSQIPFTKMTTAQLAKATAEFNKEFVVDTFHSPGPKAKQKLAKAKRKRGRPRVGQGAKAISVTVERTLLAKADALARRLKTSRAKLVEQGLRKLLKAV